MKKRYGRIVRYYSLLAAVAAIFLAVCGAGYFIPINRREFGIVCIAAGAVIGLLVFLAHRSRKVQILEYLKMISNHGNDPIAPNIMQSFPIPVIVANVDGTISWYNECLSELFGNQNLFGMQVENIIPSLRWNGILKECSNIDRKIKIDDRQYCVRGCAIKDSGESALDEDQFSVYLYLIDKTAENNLQALYENERTDIALVNIDNHDEIFQRIDDDDQQTVTSGIRNGISEWAREANAVVRKTDRDRYFVFFEHRYLDVYIEKKFDILDKVRAIGDKIKQPVSISIGIGTGGSLADNETHARQALDLALGRGGDQVSVKDDTQYKFYGGKTREYEKSTRVKTRAVALALKDFINNSDKVIFMGHGSADYDCFGAAMGLQRAVRALGKTPYVVYDNNSPGIKVLYDELKAMPEYSDMFIDANDALGLLTDNTLVVVLDTHRPSMLPCPQLVEKASKVVLVDHHRRATEFLSNCSLIYHEPYASSTCEMATELMEYMNLGGILTTVEAECLYTGILVDTKNFIVKTGVRTFEAASYLRRVGLNTVEVKRLFNINKTDYDRRADIVKTAVEITPDIAVAKCYDKFPNIRVIASQAADEMLNINSIRASIVVYPRDGGTGLSARSIGDINVQVIMEMLGGGGHMTVAGAMLKDVSIDEAVNQVRDTVKRYLKENN